MKFGVCNPYTNIALLKSEGYDYIELGFNALSVAEESEFKKIYSEVEKHSFPAEAYNGFFSADMKLVGNDVDTKAIRAHAAKGFGRAAELGGRVAVVGSGPARTIPEGFDRKRAEEQFVDVLRICGDEAGKFDMEIVIEPLQTKETNLINTVAEGLEFTQRADHEKVRCLVDFYHVFKSGESLEALENSNGLIRHAHIARANIDRKIPTIEDAEICELWSKALKKCGYDLRLSLEGAFSPDVPTAIKEVKPILDMFK